MATLSRHKIKNTFSDEIEGVPRSPSHKSRIWKLSTEDVMEDLDLSAPDTQQCIYWSLCFTPPLNSRCMYWAQFEPLFLAPVGKAGSVGGMVAASRATGPEGSRRRPVSPNPAENSQAEKFRRKFRESATNTKAALRTLPLKHFDFKSVYVLCVF